MANQKLKLKENICGNFFVDSTCIDCDACRRFAPSTFGDTGEYAFVQKQPANEIEMIEAKRALISCPVGSIGTMDSVDFNKSKQTLPLKLINDIYLNGFNARDSFGGDSYFIKSERGNWLVDSPRFHKHLVKKFEEMGGLKYIFLSHQDDVADANFYAKQFGAKRIIHELDSGAQLDAEIIVKGEIDRVFDDGRIIFTPGHSKGHQVLLWKNKYLFTGDHFAWLRQLNHFGSFRDACWYSWETQIKSVDKLKNLEEVQWIFPGHGRRGRIKDGNFSKIIKNAVDWMRTV